MIFYNKKVGKVKLFKSKIIKLLSQLILGSIFIYAGIGKIINPDSFANSIKSYKLLPVTIIPIVSVVLPWIEFIFGILLIVGLFIKFSAIALTSLMIIFMTALSIQAIKGNIIDCGCFDKASILSSANLLFLFARDFILLSLGLIIIFSSEKHENNINLR